MTDYTELKRLAEACGDLNWHAIQENWCEWAIRDDHGYIAVMRTKSAKHPGPCSDREAKAKFLCAMTPAAVLSLIAENERLERKNANQSESIREYQDLVMGDVSLGMLKADLRVTTGERDQLRAEIAGLRTGYEAYEQVNAELKAECEALRNALTCEHREAFEAYFRCCAMANGKDEAWVSKNLERAEDGTYMRAKAYDGWCYWMAAKDFAAEIILKEGR